MELSAADTERGRPLLEHLNPTFPLVPPIPIAGPGEVKSIRQRQRRLTDEDVT